MLEPHKQKRPPEGGLPVACDACWRSGCAERLAVLLPAVRHEAKAAEAEDHHGPGGGLGDGGRHRRHAKSDVIVYLAIAADDVVEPRTTVHRSDPELVAVA